MLYQPNLSRFEVSRLQEKVETGWSHCIALHIIAVRRTIARVMWRDRQRGWARGARGAVVCSGPLDVAQGQGEWLTTKIQQNKRWRRGVGAGTPPPVRAATPPAPAATQAPLATYTKIDARSATGNQHKIDTRKSDNTLWVTSFHPMCIRHSWLWCSPCAYVEMSHALSSLNGLGAHGS